MAQIRAQRVETPERTRMHGELPVADYTCAFELPRPAADRRTAEQWARAVFEDAPRPMRAFLTLGWRVALGLHLASHPANDHVLGWRIRSAQPDLLVLEQDSRLITGQNVVQVDDTRIVWSTFVGYRNVLGRVAWTLAVPFHLLTIPRLLRRAAGDAGPPQPSE